MFQIKDLLLLPTLSRAKLIAGESGLTNRVRWSYKAESMDIASWVHGNELLIVSSAVINSENFDMEKLVKEAIRLHLSGVLLLVGESYVQSLPSRLLGLSDRSHFPLIGLPADVPLVDVFEELGHAIAYHDRDKFKGGDLLSGIVFGTSVNKEMIRYQAQAIDYPIEKAQRIFMIHMDFSDPTVAELEMQNLQSMLEDFFRKNNCHLVLSGFSCNLVGITCEARTDLLEEIFSEFLSQIPSVQRIDSQSKVITISCRIGIGSIHEQLEKLSDSFREASRCISLLEQSNAANNILWFEKLGFARLLLSIPNQELILRYMDQVLKPVTDYDAATDGHLFETLKTWFDCNESMKQASVLLYTHPNTVKYRLTKIEELTGFRLTDSHEKLELFNAVMIRTYLT